MKELMKTIGLGFAALGLFLGASSVGFALVVAWVGALIFWSFWLYGAFVKLFEGGF